MGEHHNHIHNHEITESDELVALLNYMVSHNEAHTSELTELAKHLDTEENSQAYALVLQAIEEYKSGNELLQTALDLLK